MLTAKQEAFVQNLISGMSQRQAYRAAYNVGKMTDKTIDETASKLLKRPKVAARYEELCREIRAEGEKAAVASAVEVLEELTAIAFARGTDYAQVVGGRVILTDTGGLTDRQKAAVVSIKETQAGVEVKLADKVKALETLAKYHCLLTEKVNLAGAASVQIVDDLGADDG